MLRRFILLAVSILAGLNLPEIALGQEEGILLFGPQVFIRGKGKPVIESAKFFPLDPSAETTLNIFNGDANGDFKVSSAKVYLNGKPVFGPRNFNQKVDFISVPVALIDGENIIEVQLRAKPGSFVTIDITAPDIVIGPEGGTATTTAGTKIEIPPDALTEDTVITIDTLTEETLPAPVPEGLEFLGAADFQPDGLTFSVLVTITIPLNISLPPGSFLGLFVFDPETGEFVYAEKYGTVDESGETASIEIEHFSALAFLTDKLLRVGIIGRVVTKDGEPVANATVTIVSVKNDVGDVWDPDAPPVTTRQDGFFSVSFGVDLPNLTYFKVEAIHVPSGAKGEATGKIQEQFRFKPLVATLLGVPTDWEGLAKLILELLAGAGLPPKLLTTDLIGYGGGAKIEVPSVLMYFPIDKCVVHDYFPDRPFPSAFAASHHDRWGTRYSYIKFDISALPSNIVSAKLRAYMDEAEWDGPAEVGLYKVADTTWDGSTMTWNNKPSMGSKIDSDVGPVNSWFEWDITSVIKTGGWCMAIKPLSGHAYASHFHPYSEHIEVVPEN